MATALHAHGGILEHNRRMLETLMLAAALTSPVEQRIAAAVDRRSDEGLALLEHVVNINSGTMNVEGVRKVGDVFRAELDALGLKTRWIEGAPFKRAGHLVGEHAGTGTHILLIGHLDTVFDSAGAADVAFVADLVKMTLDGIGLMGHDESFAQGNGGPEHVTFADKARRDPDVPTRACRAVTPDEEARRPRS